MWKKTRPAAIVIAVIGLSSPLLAFIQDRTSSGAPVRWNLASGQPNISNGQVEYVINKRGSEDVAFVDVASAVEAAFDEWSLRNSSVIDFARLPDPSTLVEGTRPNRIDQVNAVYWDEDPRNGFMIPPDAFGVTLRTPLDPNSGQLDDVDIVLNGFQYLWTSQGDGNFSSRRGPVDIQEALTASVGEFIGLNRVPTAGSVMQETNYPGDIFRTGLSSDELAAVLELYPPTPDPGVTSISGRVTRSGMPLFGAYIAAFQSGVPMVGAISDPNGLYSIRRIPPGSYSVRALTLSPPITSLFYGGIDPAFQSEAFLNSVSDPATAVLATAGTDTPNIDMDVAASASADPWEPDNDPNSANAITPNGPRQIHHTFPASDLDFVKFTATAGDLYVVETSNLGSGLVVSDTVLDLMSSPTPPQMNDDRNVKQKSRSSRLVFRAAASGTHFIRARQSIPGTAGSGTAFDITVTDLGTTTPTPTVSFVTPGEGSQSGGYQVSVFGTDFMPGASVSLGGVAGSEVDVVSDTKLFVTVPPTTTPGPVDVTVTNPGGSPSTALPGGFTYLGDVTTLGTFVDATFTAFAPFPFVPGTTTAVAWTDYDNDRDLDLFFTTDGALPTSSQLGRNEGGGTFTQQTASSLILVGDATPESATWGDFDNDGCIDVYKVNLVVASNNVLLKNNCDGAFTDVTAMAGVAGRTNGRSRDAAWADFDNDGFIDLYVGYDDLAGPNQLFRNQHNGTFVDVAVAALVDSVGSTVSVDWADFNNDDYDDLFLVRAGTEADILYKNNKNGTFTDATAAAGLGDTPQGTDAVWGDFNNDGWMDLYVVAATGFNRMFKNNGNGTFMDVSAPSGGGYAGTGDTLGSAQAVNVEDYDNDGKLDIFVAQSFDGLNQGSWIDVLFHNEGGNLTFSDATFDAGVNDGFDGLSAAFGDYTGNGAPDLFVGNVGSGNDFLWQNQANKYDALVVQLVGTISNRFGIGARVSVTSDLDGTGPQSNVTQIKEMLSGSKGQNPVELHFGLGRANVESLQVGSVEVTWPASGLTSGPFSNLSPNQVLTIYEGDPGISVTRVASNSGPTTGNTTVVITGMNFEANATIDFGGVPTTILPPGVMSDRITAVTPAHAAGAVDVTVTNPFRSAGDPYHKATLPGGFIYVSGDPLESLECVDPENTVCIWGPVSGAAAYDVIRGNLGSLQVSGGTEVNLGSVKCIEDESADTTTGPNHLDPEDPAPGAGFFYLFRVSGGNYGSSSSGLPRVPGAGACP